MSTFLLELGTEDMPAGFVTSALAQWEQLVPASLALHQLSARTVRLYGTPRRLALVLEGLPPRQTDQEVEYKGPSVQAAFSQGQPTPAALGFARSRGVQIEDLERRTTEKGEFLFLRQVLPGRPTQEILPALGQEWILGLEAPRMMRWGTGNLKFSRPIRWLVSLWEDQVLPLTLGALTSGQTSPGHRVMHPQRVTINGAGAYQGCLEAAWVQVDPDRRRQQILSQVQAQAAAVGGWAEVPASLLAEVVHLVEWPSAGLGNFEPEFLSLPAAVTTTVMITHQRYFPVWDSERRRSLLPHFIAVSNGNPDRVSEILLGNERVIRARLADARFFYQADLSQPLVDYLPRLETVTFQEALGSMAAKVERIGQGAARIAQQLALTPSERLVVERTALLCKADLVTQMVGEFPELQGIMGETYAAASGEPLLVAQGIREHYLPRHPGDDLPQSYAGQVVGIADRLDTLVSIFGLGLAPTGSSDPFALRRAANAVVQVVLESPLNLDLLRLLREQITSFSSAYPHLLPSPDLASLEAQLLVFWGRRLRSYLQEDLGIDYDLVDGVLGKTQGDPGDLRLLRRALEDLGDLQRRAQWLRTSRVQGTLGKIYPTVNRATRLAAQGDLPADVLDPQQVLEVQYLSAPVELALAQALQDAHGVITSHPGDYPRLTEVLQAMTPVLERFFDGPESVLVMDPDPVRRRNRLNLLGLLRNQAALLADFGVIVNLG